MQVFMWTKMRRQGRNLNQPPHAEMLHVHLSTVHISRSMLVLRVEKHAGSLRARALVAATGARSSFGVVTAR